MKTSPSSTGTGSALYVGAICLIATLGGLLFGYDTGVISGAIEPLTACFHLSDFMKGWASGCVLIGCAAGVLLVGPLSDRFGRKMAMFLAALMFLASAIGTALPRDIWVFILFRFLGGVGIGIASISTPMYIAEIAPARIRGRLVSVNQIAIVGGIAATAFINYFIAHSRGDPAQLEVQAWLAQTGWRWMFATGVAPSVLFGLLLFFIPESPRWLARQGSSDKARAILVRVLGEQEAGAGMAQITKAITPGGERPVSEVLFSFRGRIDRAAFWEVWVSLFIINAVGEFLLVMAARRGMLNLLGLPWLVISLWIAMAMQAKRWHDRGKSAWMILINFIPIAGWMWAFVELGFRRGTPAENQYGAVPNERGTLADLFKPGLRRALFVGIALAMLQQVTGINVFLYFGATIFRSLSASTGVDAGLLQQIIINGACVLFTLVAIATVDKWGRKPLMCVGTVGMGLSLLGMGVMAQTLTKLAAAGGGMLFFILLYIACFGLSVGPVTWVILSEIFPTAVRGRALGLATFFLWMADYAVTQTFPVMDASDSWFVARFNHAFPFYVYAVFCVVLLIVMARWVPETKGRSLEEIEGFWGKTGRSVF